MSPTETARSGVDARQLLGTLDAIEIDPALAAIRDFYAACRAATSRSDMFDMTSTGVPIVADMEAP